MTITMSVIGNAQAVIKNEVEQIIRDGSSLKLNSTVFASLHIYSLPMPRRSSPAGGVFVIPSPRLEPVPTGVHVIMYTYPKTIKILRREKEVPTLGR